MVFSSVVVSAAILAIACFTLARFSADESAVIGTIGVLVNGWAYTAIRLLSPEASIICAAALICAFNVSAPMVVSITMTLIGPLTAVLTAFLDATASAEPIYTIFKSFSQPVVGLVSVALVGAAMFLKGWY